jgi:hypothetical protein
MSNAITAVPIAGRDITAHSNRIVIGELDRITYITDSGAAMGTITFKDCIADPRGCDIHIYTAGEQTTREIFKAVDMSDNLYLGAVIVFSTNEYIKETFPWQN